MPPGEWTVQGIVTILLANATLSGFGAVTKGVSQLVTVESHYVGAGAGNMVRWVTLPGGLGLTIMLDTCKSAVKT